ncbi:MAG: SDR family oxidoreductase [bacterium]|nr:SDR family oxidoreductase [bacterium]
MGEAESKRPVAFVTGASRGIGRASALRLAEAGFDLVLTGRSVSQPVDHGGHALRGSLREVEKESAAHGAAAVCASLDLLDPASIRAAVASGLERFGRIDAVVHSATHIADGNADDVLALKLDALDESLRANVVGSTCLMQAVLPKMIERGAGVWISLVSGAAVLDPPHRASEGGWGFLYGSQKAALFRLAGVVNSEFGDRGIRAYNLQPGIVSTEVLRKSFVSDGPLEEVWGVAPPEIPAAVIEWLITQDLEGARLGRGVVAQKLCAELGLVEGWHFE